MMTDTHDTHTDTRTSRSWDSLFLSFTRINRDIPVRACACVVTDVHMHGIPTLDHSTLLSSRCPAGADEQPLDPPSLLSPSPDQMPPVCAAWRQASQP